MLRKNIYRGKICNLTMTYNCVFNMKSEFIKYKNNLWNAITMNSQLECKYLQVSFYM